MQNERREGRRFSRGRGRTFPPKPVELGKEYDVEVREVSRRGGWSSQNTRSSNIYT